MKRIVGCLIIILISFCLTGCGHIEDTNGSNNYELTTITKGDIIGSMNSTSFGSVEWHKIYSGSLKIKKFSGVGVVDNRKINNQNVVINLTTTVKSGNFGLFVLTNDWVYEIPINQEYNLNIGQYTGNCTIKYAGASAEFAVTYEYIYK